MCSTPFASVPVRRKKPPRVDTCRVAFHSFFRPPPLTLHFCIYGTLAFIRTTLGFAIVGRLSSNVR